MRQRGLRSGEGPHVQLLGIVFYEKPGESEIEQRAFRRSLVHWLVLRELFETGTKVLIVAMDHYPLISDPHKPIKVPYLGGSWASNSDIDCSDLNLDEFRANLERGNTTLKEQRQIMAQVQARLFFGMLSGVLQVDISTSNYKINEQSPTCTLTTRNLKADLDRWKVEHERLREHSHSERHISTDESKTVDAASELESRRTRAETCLYESFVIWNTLNSDALESERSSNHEEFFIIQLSIQMLGKTLQHAVESVSQFCDTCPFEPWVKSSSVPWRRDNKNAFLTNRMLDQGWCPAVIEVLRRKGDLPLMYYSSLLGPPVRRGHKAAGCTATDTGCRMLDIRQFAYEPLHTVDCSRKGCEFLSPGKDGMEEATKLIEKGRIPILYLDGRGNLQVTPQGRGKEYTAISHVWTDGLGHPENQALPGWRSNSLPACQIRKIVSFVSKLPWTKSLRTTVEEYDDKVWKIIESIGERPSYALEEMSRTIYFWIDTICVPHNHAKGKAIAQMAAVYSRANRVLVLDNDLMATSLRAPTDAPIQFQVRPDFGARLIASNWQRRYWTLQEAVLAKKLWFQFKDDAYERKTWAELVEFNARQKARLNAEVGNSNSSASVPLPMRPNYIEYWWDNEICYYTDPHEYSWATSGIGAIAAGKPPDNGKTCKACEDIAYGACAACRALCARASLVWRELGPRTCSFSTDKPVCIAILLDLDVSVFESVSDELERIYKLWEQFTAVPAGLLSLPSRKCKKSHLRWAPIDLDHLSRYGVPIWHPAHITPKGVDVRLHGFTAVVPKPLNAKSVIPVALGDTVYFIRNNTNFGNERWVEGPLDDYVVNVSFTDVVEIGVILGQEPLGEGEPFPQLPASLGTLVKIRRREANGTLIVVEYVGAVSVIGKGTMFERLTTTPWSETEEAEKLKTPLVGQPTAINQRWLIEP